VAALHVVNAGSLRHLMEVRPGTRFEVQRFRPNIVIESFDPPFAENTWSGATVRFGTALLATVLLPTMRCIMTTLAQGALPRDNEILRTVSSLNRLEIPGLGTSLARCKSATRSSSSGRWTTCPRTIGRAAPATRGGRHEPQAYPMA
jgi:uncharacterized protein YcbX